MAAITEYTTPIYNSSFHESTGSYSRYCTSADYSTGTSMWTNLYPKFEKYLYTPITQQTLYELNYITSVSSATTCTINGTDISDLLHTWNNTITNYTTLYSSKIQQSLFVSELSAIHKSRLKSNLIVCVKSRSKMIANACRNEQIALEALRESISETEYRKYLTYGFVLVKGNSGDTFQIFRNKSHTKVWRNGKVIEEICVRIKDSSVPMTDNVLAFKTIIEADENEFRKLGNVYKTKAA